MSKFVYSLLACGGFILPALSSHGRGPGVEVTTTDSLVHLGSIDSFDTTEEGITAGRLLLDAIRTGNTQLADQAAGIYRELVPKENFGGEYTALQWVCEYLSADQVDKDAMTQDPMAREFQSFLGENDYELLQEFLVRKYRLEKIGDENSFEAVRRETFLQDYVLFNNPRRESWEHSSRFLKALNIRPGMSLADVGCGPGYFTVKFSQLVGSQGKVFASDINETHTKYLDDLTKRLGLKNVSVARPDFDNICLDEKVDLIWLCSFYHIMYVLASEAELDSFIGSVKKALKPSGRLVVVDNALVQDRKLPYHGPYVAKELIIDQLAYYGWNLVECHQFIPQRYMLVFEQETPQQAAAL